MVQFAAALVRRASLRVVAAQWAGHKTVLTNAPPLIAFVAEAFDKIVDAIALSTASQIERSFDCRLIRLHGSFA